MKALIVLPARLSTSTIAGLITCDAVLCKTVHLRCPDLDLQREELLRAQRQHGGVQRLVAVGLGRGDVVLHGSGYWRPHGVHQALQQQPGIRRLES